MKWIHGVTGVALAVAAICAGCQLHAETLDTSLFQANASLKVAGYKGASTLTDFPVLVRLRGGFPAGFAYADAGTDGAGIRFADAEGNLLPHEIDTWNTNGESAVWVKLSAMTNGTTLRVYWKAGATTLPSVTASDVWTKYVAVLHGNDYTNSSDSGLACQAGGTTSNDTTSIVGGAAYANTQNSMGIKIANPVTNGKVTLADGVTFSGWFRPTTLDASGYNIVIAASEPTWNKGGFLALWEQSYFFSVAVNGHQGVGRGSQRVVQANVWEHLAFSYAGTNLAIYEDGNSVWSSTSAKQFRDMGQDYWVVGSYTTQTADSFIGQMDEIRLYNGVASADWIKAEYDAAKDPLFLVKADPVPSGTFGAIAYLQAVGYSGSETLSGFPVPVRIRAGFPNGFAYADVSDPTADIRFFDMDGNLLPHEVDTWNTEGESLVWVRMTSLPTGGAMFRMGWKRDTTVPLAANVSSDVWTKYVAVLHGNDYTNSSDSGLACQAGGTTSNDATSMVGGAAYANTQNTMGINIANPVTNGKVTLTDGVTFSGWFRPTKLDACGYNIVIAASEPSWNKGGFLALWEQSYFFSVAVNGHQGVGRGSERVVQANVWEHLAFSYAGTNLAIYEDGSSVWSSTSAKQFRDMGQDYWVVGSYTSQTADSFIGQMDEIRLYNGVASADWIKAEYASAENVNYVAEIDNSTVVRAVWTNAKSDGNIADSGNWTCYNSFGDIVENGLPSAETTTAYVIGETSFSLSSGTPIWSSLIFENVVLTNDCDWSALGSDYILDGTLDLNGCSLMVTAYPVSNGTITDTKGGASFILDVPADTVVGNGTTVLAGSLKFVKKGAGTFRPSGTTQTYTGGTEIQAGIAENVTTTGAAAYGQAKTTIKVCDGASFDWHGACGTAYSMDIAGDGVDGEGAVWCSVDNTSPSTWWELDRIANITLSADATMDASGGLFGLTWSGSTLHEVNLNGYTLTITSNSSIGNHRQYFRGIKTVGDGKILITNAGGTFYGPASDLTSATLEITELENDFLAFEVSPTIGTFIDHRLSSPDGNYNRYATVYVSSCLVPYANVPVENVCLTNDSAEVTLDLSHVTGTFSNTVATASSTRTLTFGSGTTIVVDVYGRNPCPEKVLDWGAGNRPEGVTFKIDERSKAQSRAISARDDGIYIFASGMMIIIR